MTYIGQHENIDLIQTCSSVIQKQLLYWNEKNISTGYENKKESTNQGGHFLDFYRFSWSYVGPKSNLHPARIFHQLASLITYAATFSNTCIDFLIFLKKKKKALALRKKLLNFNETYMDRKQPFERFLKMDTLSSQFFGP